MITAVNQTQTLNNINNISIPRPRFQNKIGLNQQADVFTPSFCANPEHLSTKLGSFFEKLFTPINNNSEKSKYFKEMNDNIPSSYKF